MGFSLKSITKPIANVAQVAYKGSIDIATLGQGKKLDEYTGGLYSASVNVGNTGKNLVEGKSVRENLKDAVRVGAVVGAGIAGGPAGAAGVNAALSSNGKTRLNVKSALGAAGNFGTGSDFVDNIFKSIGVTPSSQEAPIDSQDYFSDGTFGAPVSSNKKVILILGGLAAILLVVYKARKK